MSRNRRDQFSHPKRVGEAPVPLDGGIIDPPPEGETAYGVTYGKTQRVGGDTPGSTQSAAQDESGTDTRPGK